MTIMTPIPRAERLQGVLAYVADAESEAALQRVSISLAGPGLTVRRGSIATAARDLAHERSPALLLVDVSGIDRVLDAVQALSDVCEPQVQVVAIGNVNDVGLFRGLLRLGVADYLFKPVTAELLEQLFTRLLGGPASGMDARLGKLVTVVGARGGVGSSSMAANIAHFLAEKAQRRVALLDMDLCAGAQALMLGATPNAGLADALANPSRIDDLLLERASTKVTERLDLLASAVPEADAVGAVSLEATRALIDRLQRAYHYVVADVPQVAMARCQPLLAMANVQLLVTEANLLAARDTQLRQATATALGQRQIVVQNRAGRPGDLAAAAFAAILHRPPDVAMPFLPQAFGQGINLGQPAWQHDKRAEAGIALLARELSGQSVVPAPPPAWQRWLGLVP